MQTECFVLAKRIDLCWAEYLAAVERECDLAQFDRFRKDLHPADGQFYRGFSRQCLQPFDHAGEASESFEAEDAAARTKFMCFVGEYSPDRTWERNLALLDQARDIHGLLLTPAKYEILHLRRVAFKLGGDTLGFDIGWWGQDWFSILCDAALMPRWHGPPPEVYPELASRVRLLNRHMLFPDSASAEEYLDWYRVQSWAEAELNGENWDPIQYPRFEVVQVDEVKLIPH